MTTATIRMTRHASMMCCSRQGARNLDVKGAVIGEVSVYRITTGDIGSRIVAKASGTAAAQKLEVGILPERISLVFIPRYAQTNEKGTYTATIMETIPVV